MTPSARPRSVQRLRLGAVCLAITLLVFTQSAGLEAADTKLDLVVAPWRFLVASLSAWYPTAAAGELQNQAYGYLFPMGPFFLLAHLAALPAWVIERGWESVLVVTAFLGTVRLARLLGVRGSWPRILAGLAYALAPRMLMEIGVISAELIPVAVAPWVLIPLVSGSRGGSPRRAAARSGVALLLAGGTNAAATLAILPIPILWLLTRERGRRRGALARWWALAVVMASLWWAVPLVVLGKYSPPFLDWIESASNTTRETSLATSLRGAEHWEAYLGRGVWPAGYDFVAIRTIVLATAVVALLGVVGITLPRNPHRLFLGCCLGIGLVLLTFGHVASIGPPLGGSERSLLDGALNAFRNIHKFDPVVRLPIALGIGHVSAAAVERWRAREQVSIRTRSLRVDPRVVAALAGGYVLVAAVAPAFAGDLVPQVRSVNDPTWWQQTGRWLAHAGGDGRALVVPGAAQPVYVWGSPRDDALQPEATSPWTVRESTPLAQAGYVRLLDEIEARLAAGRSDPTLATVLARSGIRYVVVRNDLDTTASAATPVQFVYSTLQNSGGFRQVAGFGPNPFPTDTTRLVDEGATASRSAVTVFANERWRGPVAMLPADQSVLANGSADNLTSLTAAGVTANQPVIFAPSALPPSAGARPMTALTDGIRRREFGFGGISRYSDTMTATQPFVTTRAAHDYLPDPAPPLSTAEYIGIANVDASSSGADVDAYRNISPANGPWSAVDGSPFTAWRIGAYGGAVGQWLQVDLRSAINTGEAMLTLAGLGDGFPNRIEVSTAAGHLDEQVTPNHRPQPIRIPAGPTRYVRITILGIADGSSGFAAGITELRLPGVTTARTLRVPGSTQPDLITFAVADGQRGECITVNGYPACDPAWATFGEEDLSLDRSFTLSDSGTYDTRAQLRLRPGRALDQVLNRGNPLHAAASSVASADPRSRAGAAVDGDPSTVWMAAPSDLSPSLAVYTTRAHRLTGVRVVHPAAIAPARAPVEVQVSAGRVHVDADLPPSGVVRFPHPVTTAAVTIHVVRARLRTTTSSASGASTFLPVGIAEVDLLGRHVPHPPSPLRPVVVGCHAGLAMTVEGRAAALRVTAPRSAVLAGDSVAAVPCATPAGRSLGLPPTWIRLGSGTNRVTLPATGLVAPVGIVMSRVGQPYRSPPIAMVVHRLTWGSTKRSVSVRTAVPALLIVHENSNAGWSATLHGTRLRPVLVDGWQQAWLIPAGSSGVVMLRFGPQTGFDVGLGTGAAAAAGLVVLALLPGRRRSKTTGAPPVATATLPVVVRWIVLAAILGLLGSLAGLVVAAVLTLAAGLVPPARRASVATWTIVGALGAAAVAETLRTAASADPLAGSPGVQLLCLVAIGAVLIRCIVADDRPPPRPGEAPQ
jgi:arabinofuranan 3-O-arabinosyltransferase